MTEHCYRFKLYRDIDGFLSTAIVNDEPCVFERELDALKLRKARLAPYTVYTHTTECQVSVTGVCNCGLEEALVS